MQSSKPGGLMFEEAVVQAEGGQPVLASGCGAVSTFLAARAVSGRPQHHRAVGPSAA